MLVLNRKINEAIRIGDDIQVKVVRISSSKVRLGIQAPQKVKLRKGEMAESWYQERREWAKQHRFCWVCGWVSDNLQTHEIVRRSRATHGEAQIAANWFRVCPRCHGGPLASMPLVNQLAYKLKYDAANYNTADVRGLLDSGRSPVVFSDFEVIGLAEEL